MITLPKVYLARRGETPWSLSGQHTSFTDLALDEQGQKDARQLGKHLQSLTFGKVFSSPLKRALQTTQLAGYGEQVILEPLLTEWNYGDYEGLKTIEIKQKKSDWNIFKDGCPGGESPKQIADRCDMMVKKIRSINETVLTVLLVAHAHILRMFTTRWLGLPPTVGACYVLSQASLSILGYDHDLSEPVIRLWNDTSYLTLL